MITKACPRCKRLIPHGLAYCSECAPIAEAQRAEAKERKEEQRRKRYNQKYNRQRDPKYARFYNSGDWRVLSKAKLSDCGYKCEAKLPGCKRVACEVHHIKPIKTPEGWDLRLDWDNLQGVCISCHNILDNKTFKPRGADGVLDMREITKNLRENK